jgi:hypothetical protein
VTVELHAWRALLPWIGDLASDGNPANVRCNVAMLAADLAARGDAESLAALADMVAKALDRVALGGSADDRLVSETVLAERGRLDPGKRQSLDALALTVFACWHSP